MSFWWLVHLIYILWWWFLLLLSCVLIALTHVVGDVGGCGWGEIVVVLFWWFWIHVYMWSGILLGWVWLCCFCFGFLLVLLCHMCIVYLGICKIVIWNYPLGWRMRGWFSMLILMGFRWWGMSYSWWWCVFCILFLVERVFRAMDDLKHPCCLNLGRCREPPYLVVMYLARLWYMMPNWHGSLRVCISCWPMPKFSWGRCVRILAVLLDILHIVVVIMMIILSSFFLC